MDKVEITTEFIKLDALLKFAGLCETGGSTEKPSVFVRGGKIEITAEGAG